jgi:hypothetical protein
LEVHASKSNEGAYERPRQKRMPKFTSPTGTTFFSSA